MGVQETVFVCGECSSTYPTLFYGEGAWSAALHCHRAEVEAITDTTEQMFAMSKDDATRAAELAGADPSLGITAVIMAADARQMRFAEAAVARGTPATKAIVWVGSFSRMQFALKHFSPTELLADVADLWRGADPDDRDPAYLDMWRTMREMNGGPIYDGFDKLPEGEFKVWRGQDDPGDPPGLSWTLDRAVAEKFARGAGVRQGNRKGVVVEAVVDITDVFAYLVGRNEAEVVCWGMKFIDWRSV